MSKAALKIAVTGLTFTGNDQPAVGVSFNDGLKRPFWRFEYRQDFIVKSIDFMLGGKDLCRYQRTHWI